MRIGGRRPEPERLVERDLACGRRQQVGAAQRRASRPAPRRPRRRRAGRRRRRRCGAGRCRRSLAREHARAAGRAASSRNSTPPCMRKAQRGLPPRCETRRALAGRERRGRCPDRAGRPGRAAPTRRAARRRASRSTGRGARAPPAPRARRRRARRARDWRDGLAVPVEPEPGQRAGLRLLAPGPYASAVEILEAQQEAAARMARPEPGDQRRARVAEVEIPGRARCIAADIHARTHATVAAMGLVYSTESGRVRKCQHCGEPLAGRRPLPVPRAGRARAGRRHPARAARDVGAQGQDRDDDQRRGAGAGDRARARASSACADRAESVVDGVIEIQGDHRAKVVAHLQGTRPAGQGAGG